MSSKLFGLVAFAAGVLAGGFFVKRSLERHYQEIADEEIQSVKKAFRVNPKKDSVELIDERIDRLGYSSNSRKAETARRKEPRRNTDILKEEPERKREETKVDKPYLISPKEFGELEDYDTIDLTYYSDHVLADDMNGIIDDVDDIVGFESLAHFGDYEDDAVFVRNDRLKCDYEILRDYGTYDESKRRSR